VKRVITYLILFILSLYGIRTFHYANLLSVDEGYYDKYKAAFLKSNKYDFLILGSSRAQMHYNTGMIDSIWNCNSFNLSYNGANIQQAYILLKCYLAKSIPPKVLFYEMDYHVFNTHEEGWMDFQNLFPFLKDENTFDYLRSSDKRFLYARYFPFYSLPNTGVKNFSTGMHYFFGKSLDNDRLYYKGYFKNCIQPNLNYKPSAGKYQWINRTDRDYLDSLIFICKNKDIQLNLISSPIFGGGKLDVINHTQLMRQINNIAAINGLRYTNYSSLPFCNQRNLFIDHHHLNANGSVLFTRYLCKTFQLKKFGQ